MSKQQYIVGVDEAGRGPLAGPVAVGIVVVPHDFDWRCIPGVGDSKKIKPENREAIFKQAQQLKKEGKINFVVIQKSAIQIDKRGIAVVIREAIAQGLSKLPITLETTRILLDGSLKAPEKYIHQETIIKGDAKEQVIGLASVLAKVTRDRYMVRISRKFPEYELDIHKGYGTKKHRENIRKYGLIKGFHRESFLRNVIKGAK